MGKVAEVPAAVNPELLTVKKLSDRLGISSRTLWRLAAAGKIPAPAAVGGRRYWLRRTIDRWLEAGCQPIRK